MICCDHCEMWYHMACIKQPCVDTEQWYCDMCVTYYIVMMKMFYHLYLYIEIFEIQ